MTTQFVWIFNNSAGRFPGGVFQMKETADDWILANQLTGVLTKYPVNIGSFDWAKTQGLASDKLLAKANADFIGSFSSAGFEHYHYEEGQLC